jgi:acyl carrier protein
VTDPMTDPIAGPDGAILATLTGILRDLLDDPDIVLHAATTRPEVPRWDSFAYVSFIVAVEVAYGIKFPIVDVESFKTVGDIVTAIARLERA